MNQMCMICKYDTHPSEYRSLERLKDKLNTIFRSENIKAKSSSRSNRFNWYSNNKCKVGMTCSKTNMYNSKFNTITDELNTLMNTYIEETDCSGYRELLTYLQGFFPNVYRDFETRVNKKLNNN